MKLIKMCLISELRLLYTMLQMVTALSELMWLFMIGGIEGGGHVLKGAALMFLLILQVHIVLITHIISYNITSVNYKKVI